MADDDRLQDGFYHGSTKTAELILLASAVVCLKGVPESENLFIKFNAGCHDSYICAMDSVTHCFFLISTAISWHALIFLLPILHACQFESFCLWRSFLKFLLAEWRFLKLFFFSFVLFFVCLTIKNLNGCECPPWGDRIKELGILGFVSDTNNPILEGVQHFVLKGTIFSQTVTDMKNSGNTYLLKKWVQHGRPLSSMSEKTINWLFCMGERRLVPTVIPYHQYSMLTFVQVLEGVFVDGTEIVLKLERNGKFQLEDKAPDIVAATLKTIDFTVEDNLTLQKVIDYVTELGGTQYNPFSNCQTQTNTVLQNLLLDEGLDPVQAITTQCLADVKTAMDIYKRECEPALDLKGLALIGTGIATVLLFSPIGWGVIGFGIARTAWRALALEEQEQNFKSLERELLLLIE
jgi:hypothetical protein